MATITCKIPAGLNAALEAQARQQRVPKSQIVREALETRLRKSRKAAMPTAYDLAKHLRGAVRGVPRDLASNPKYMDGYGA